MTVTEREILSPHNGRVPRLDSPAVSTRARARLPVTERVGKWKTSAVSSARTWWGFTACPASYVEMWQASRVDETRIPGRSGLLRGLWLVSNWTDRIVLFVLIVGAPTFCTGPLRWLATRPTRRWGFYLITAILAAALLLGGE